MASAPEESQSPELFALERNSYKLCQGITFCSNVHEFALLLVEKSFITSKGSNDILHTTGVSKQEKCDQLLNAVREQVRINPRKFESFVGILRQEPALSCYTDILINVRDTEAEKCTATDAFNAFSSSSPTQSSDTIPQPAIEFGKVMIDLTDILQGAEGALKHMVIAFEHIAHYMKNKTYIAIVQSKAYEAVDSVQGLFRLLGPHLNPADCSLLKALVEAARVEQAIRRLDEYLHMTSSCLLDCSSDKVPTPRDMRSSSLQPVAYSTSVPVTTVIDAKEMSWGLLRSIKSIICGIFAVPSYALQYVYKGPGSVVITCITSLEMLSQIKSTLLNDGDMLLLLCKKVVSLQIGKIDTIIVGNCNYWMVCPSDKQEPTVDTLSHIEEVCPSDKQEPTVDTLSHIEELAGCSLAPSSNEVQNYFLEHIVPAVSKWQLEPPSASTCASPLGEIEDFLRRLAIFFQRQLSASLLTLPQIFCSVNPNVWNTGKSQSFVAIVLDDLRKMGFTVNRNSIEQAVRECGVGPTTDNRYFAKNSSTPILLGKKHQQKKRCCTIDKGKVAKDAVQSLIGTLVDNKKGMSVQSSEYLSVGQSDKEIDVMSMDNCLVNVCKNKGRMTAPVHKDDRSDQDTQQPETDRESDDMSRRDQSVSVHSRKKRQMRAPVHKDDTSVPSTEDLGMTQLPETDRESDDMSRRDQSVSVHSRKKRRKKGEIRTSPCTRTRSNSSAPRFSKKLCRGINVLDTN